MTLIIDSYAWIEFLTAGNNGAEVRRHLESEDLLLTPDLVLAEVARKFARNGLTALIFGHLQSITALSEVVPVTVDVAVRVPEADREPRSRTLSRKGDLPSFADVAILALAREYNARVLTGDPHFEGLSEVEWIGA